jgi:hypothetical protein
LSCLIYRSDFNTRNPDKLETRDHIAIADNVTEHFVADETLNP